MDTVNKGIPQVVKDTSEEPAITPETIIPKEDEDKNYVLYDKDIPSEYISAGAPGVDISISALFYLKSLGYTQAIWELHETHTKKDICNNLAGRRFNLISIIQSAEAHKASKGYGWPPATIYQYSHPNCKCRYEVKKPSMYTYIPDNAPGLPMNVSNEVLTDYKQRLFQILPDTFTVDSDMIAPDEPFRIAIINDLMDRTKIASEENWIDAIKPIKIEKSTIVDTGLGMRHPVNEGDIGFVLKQSDDKAQVYSYQYHRIFTVPKDIIRVVDLKKTDKEPKKGNFVITEDDLLGFLYKIEEDGSMIVYVPEIESTVVINKLQMLDFF